MPHMAFTRNVTKILTLFFWGDGEVQPIDVRRKRGETNGMSKMVRKTNQEY